MTPVVPTFFATRAAFRRWLARHHASASELWVGFYKKGSGRPSITWPESVDEALCFGWIDGVRRSIDQDSYVIRFTPRTRQSRWSLVNTRRAEELARLGRMRPAGQRAFDARDAGKSGAYSFERRETPSLTADETMRFRANRDAWTYFSAQPPGYRRVATWWVVSARRDDTRVRRLATLIDDSAAGRRLGPMRRSTKK
jgi:uncharacterized protein YdeI (YjbR/CyaY-like superfamily)